MYEINIIYLSPHSRKAKWIHNEYNYDTHYLFNSYSAANIFWQKKEQWIKAKYYSICNLCNP